MTVRTIPSSLHLAQRAAHWDLTRALAKVVDVYGKQGARGVVMAALEDLLPPEPVRRRATVGARYDAPPFQIEDDG